MSEIDNVFDVLIAYKSSDEEAVEKIVNLLKREGIKPWFAKELFPGDDWSSHFTEAAKKVACAAIFIGPGGIGRWEENEIKYLVSYSKETKILPIIPIQLPNVSNSDIPEIIKFHFPMKTRLKFSDSIENQASLDILLRTIKQAIQIRANKYKYEIEIDVSDAKQSCFLALPQSVPNDMINLIKAVFEDIQDSEKIEIKLNQARDTNDETTYTPDMIHAIRESELVIAICTPDNNANYPYPEVVYDLGMAHAQGKPCIILTTDKNNCEQQIPRQVGDVLPITEIIEYRIQNINAPTFKKDLKEAILKLVNHLSLDLIDKSLGEIHAIRSDFHIIRNNLWPELKNIITFAITLLNSFKDLIRQSHTLLKNINELTNDVDSIPDTKGESFKIRLNAFEKSYFDLKTEQDKWKNTYYSSDFQKNRDEVNQTYKFLNNHLREDIGKYVEESRVWFSQIIERDIAEYEKRNDNIKQFENRKFECFDNFGLTYDFEHEAKMLDKALSLITTDTHNMITSLLKGVPRA